MAFSWRGRLLWVGWMYSLMRAGLKVSLWMESDPVDSYWQVGVLKLSVAARFVHTSINNLDGRINCILIEFAGDTSLGGNVDLLELLQGGLHGLDHWAASTCMALNKAKCQVLQLGQDMPMKWYVFVGEWLGRHLQEEDLGCCLKLQWGRFGLDIGMNFFRKRLIRHWNMLSREMVESLCGSVWNICE